MARRVNFQRVTLAVFLFMLVVVFCCWFNLTRQSKTQPLRLVKHFFQLFFGQSESLGVPLLGQRLGLKVSDVPSDDLADLLEDRAAFDVRLRG